MTALRAELGAEELAGFESLDDADVRRLTDLVAAAKRDQAQAVRTGRQKALDQVPRLLRGPVRKIAGF
ncbi:MAG: hypothetical protein ACRD0G_04260 [Acidimicrobiales bacterium]